MPISSGKDTENILISAGGDWKAISVLKILKWKPCDVGVHFSMFTLEKYSYINKVTGTKIFFRKQ